MSYGQEIKLNNKVEVNYSKECLGDDKYYKCGVEECDCKIEPGTYHLRPCDCEGCLKPVLDMLGEALKSTEKAISKESK